MSAVVPFRRAQPVPSFMARTAGDRGDAAFIRAFDFLEAAAEQRFAGADPVSTANALALAVSDLQEAIGAYRQAGEGGR